MSGIGDVNGDNTPDYAVGGFGAAGYVAVYSGIDHSLVYSLTSPLGEAEGFGADLEGAGDDNGDGRADLVVGAANADVSETITNTGRLYLLSGVDGSILWEYLGQTPQGQLGRGVGGVGDVNGDGVPDVLRRLRSNRVAAPLAPSSPRLRVTSTRMASLTSLWATMQPSAGMLLEQGESIFSPAKMVRLCKFSRPKPMATG
jgi:hypothetical protein